MVAKNLLSKIGALCMVGVAASSLMSRHATADGRRPSLGEEPARGSTRSLIRPRRLTVGNHNHFMGVLGPDSRYLYYITDEFNSYDLYIQSPISAAGTPVFEAFGDVLLPAISPNGKEVAYIRYEREARGDACRRRIRDNGKSRNDREDCHATDDADLQIYWRNDGRLGILLREELHGDHVLVDGVFEKHPERKEANVVGFALSPDERWVAYVPIARRREEVGVSFSNEIGAGGIRLRRTVIGAEEQPYRPDLPGVSSYPVFSPDGKHLYFSQFLNDTNRDGRIDGDDNGVVFRVDLDARGATPKLGNPKQLTNAKWNCHYPSVREKHMAVTCAIRDKLHVYLLPPSGTVPEDWDYERIAIEADSAVDRWTELLLRQHLVASAPNVSERLVQLKALTKLHLDLREYEAAIYYGERRRGLLEDDGKTDRWSELMILFAQHRRADRNLSRGRFSEDYVQESLQRADSVKAIDVRESPDAVALQGLVLSRIYSDLGDKASADTLLTRVDLDPVRDETVIDFAHQQFNHFYRLVADYDTRLSRLKEIALHPSTSANTALRHSRGFLDLLQRGRPQASRLARLLEARRTVPDRTRLAFALDVEIALRQLTDENAQAVEAHLVGLYQRFDNPRVRRYLVLSALRASQREGVESLQQSLVELWVESAERDAPSQRTSTALYRLVVLERAYAAFAEGDLETAARYFDKARRSADSLAGHVGWIETQLLLGATQDAVARRGRRNETGKRAAVSDSEATRQFVRAYALARDLGAIESNKELRRTVEQVKKLLEASIEEDPHRPLAHLLLAHALHHRGMRLGARNDMALAIRHYLLAIDLASRRPRVRAPAHAGMALAQASLSNHRRALQDYAARLELPLVTEQEEMGLLLGYARSLFHVNEQEEAIRVLRVALGKLESAGGRGSSIEPYGPLILDRLSLYELDAGRAEPAVEAHEDLERSLERHPEARSAVNEVKTKARLSAAHLASGQPEEALASATEGRATLAAADPLRPKNVDRRIRPVTHELVYEADDLLTLLAGLEANAARQLGDWTATRESLWVRKAHLEERYDDDEVDELLLELALTSLRLAEVAQHEGKLQETRRHLEEGLSYADTHAERTGSEVSRVGFHLLRAYAELHFEGGVDLAAYERNLEQDLLRYYLFLSDVRNPKWEKERKRFEIFLSLLRLEEGSAI